MGVMLEGSLLSPFETYRRVNITFTKRVIVAMEYVRTTRL